MNNKTKNLLTIVGLLVILGAIVALYMFSVKKKESEKEETKQKEITVFKVNEDDLKKITYKNKNGEVTLIKNDDGEWRNEASKDIELNSLYTSQMSSDASKMIGTDEIKLEKGASLKPYGLKKPALEVDVETSDDKFTFYVGDESISAGGRYAYTSKDKSKLYIIGTGIYKDFDYKANQLIKVMKFPSITANSITYFKSEPDGGDDFEVSANDIKEFADYSKWKVTEPFENPLPGDDHYLGNLMNMFESVVLSECVVYDPDEKDLKKYGLDKPNSKITVKYVDAETEKNTTLKIKLGSKTDDQYIYAMTDLSDSIFTIDAIKIESLGNPDILTYVADYFIIKPVDELTHLELKGDKDMEFEVKASNDKIKVSKGDSKEADSDEFSKAYELFLSLSPVGLVKKSDIKGEDKIEKSAVFNYGDEEIKLEFYNYDGDNFYRIAVNGKMTGLLVDISEVNYYYKSMAKV